MTTIRFLPRLHTGRVLAITAFAAAIFLTDAVRLAAADASSAADDKAWTQLQKDLTPPAQPEIWQTQHPTKDQVDQYRVKYREFIAAAADKARDFHTRYPQSAKAVEARKQEYQLLMQGLDPENTNQVARLTAVGSRLAQEPSLDEKERYSIRSTGVQLAAMSRHATDPKTAAIAFEQDVRALQKEFPNRPEAWALLLEVASHYEGDKARPLLTEIINGAAPDEIKEGARGILKRSDMVGKPLELKFKAVDGSEVDLAKLNGKVVLVDFWATWCGPCVAEVPNVVKAYERLHPKGFEIVGISFEDDATSRFDLPNNPHGKSSETQQAIEKKKQDLTAAAKKKLETFVTDKKMTWPQYFDGKGWRNEFGKEFGIQSIPTMWLVDKQGNLRDLNARGELESKVEKLLAE